jgi:hypothetical protein
MNSTIRSKVVSLATINAKGNLSENDILLRRELVTFLAEEKIIELGEGGNFAFTSAESQDAYLEAFDNKKLENVYVLIRWPESQLLMDEDWFDKECHLADLERDPEVGNSAYFVPMKRIKFLQSKLAD